GGDGRGAGRGGVAAEVAQVAAVAGVSLAALYRRADCLTADRGGDVHLRVGDGKAVAGQLIALEGEVEEVAAGGPLGEHAAGAGYFRQNALDRGAQFLDLGQIRAIDLDADGCADPGGEHVDAVADGHGPGIRSAGDLQCAVHFVNEVLL